MKNMMKTLNTNTSEQSILYQEIAMENIGGPGRCLTPAEDLIQKAEAIEVSLREFAKNIQFGCPCFNPTVNALCSVTVLRLMLENGAFSVQKDSQQPELTIN